MTNILVSGILASALSISALAFVALPCRGNHGAGQNGRYVQGQCLGR